MEHNGYPYVPPTCPLAVDPAGTYVSEHGFVLQLPGFRSALVPAAADGTPPDEPGEFMTVQGVFYPVSPEPRVQPQLHTQSLRVPKDSPADARLYRMWTAEDHVSKVIEIGRRLCDRVRVCHGIEDGQCWALGARALQETIENLD